MTTKTEQGSATPESAQPSARSTELPPDDDDRQQVGSLPSIIVDPSAYTAPSELHRDDERNANALQMDEATSETQTEGASATQHTNGSGAAHDAPHPSEHTMSDTAQSTHELPPEDRLTIEEAERFAESFRPSWHSLPAVVPAPAPHSISPSAEASEPPIDSVLPPSRRRRSLALVAAAVLVFFGLIAMALNTARNPAPAPKTKLTIANTAPAAVPPRPAPAPALVAPAAPTAAPAAQPPAEPALATNEAVAQPVAQPTGAAPSDSQPAPVAEPVQAAATAVPAATNVPAAAVVPAAQPQTTPPVPMAAVTPPVPMAAVTPSVPMAAVTPVVSATVRIQLQTTPENATLLIDGATVGNPYDQMVSKSGKHHVRVAAPGYRESEITLNFDRDRDLSVRLQKLRTARTTRTARRSAPPAPSVPVTRPTTPVLSIRPSAPEKHAPAKPAPAKAPAKGAGFVSESPY